MRDQREKTTKVTAAAHQGMNGGLERSPSGNTSSKTGSNR